MSEQSTSGQLTQIPSQFAAVFRDFCYSFLQRQTLVSGMSKYRLWLIPTEFTVLELRQWHEEHPDDWMPLTVELGHELAELSFRVMETAERLEWYAEAISGKPSSMN